MAQAGACRFFEQRPETLVPPIPNPSPARGEGSENLQSLALSLIVPHRLSLGSSPEVTVRIQPDVLADETDGSIGQQEVGAADVVAAGRGVTILADCRLG